MRNWIVFTLCLTCLATGCDSDPEVAGTDAGTLPDVSDPSDELFEPTSILEVSIELPASSWETLRNETRSLIDTLTGDCLAEPFPSPFTYYEGSATIDGVSFARAGIRKKGFIGSLSTDKPSLKVKLDEYVDGQDLKGVETFTFNNSQQDPSFVRQCVSYQLFRDAGVPAPRCSFAHVTVNGADLGLFVHVESLNHEFVERRFADDTGHLYEGTLSDFRPEFWHTFEDKNELAPDLTPIQAVVDTMSVSDGDLTASLDPLVDLDEFYTFWAMEVLVRHWDGYASNTNNFYLYHDPRSGKLSFIPWGTDGALEPNPLLGDPAAPPDSVFATGVLARRLYLNPTTQATYVDRLETLLDTVWNEGEILDEIDRMEVLIRGRAQVGNPGFAAAVQEVRTAVSSRRTEIEAELAGTPPDWTQPLRAPICLEPVGTLQMTFQTTFGTIDREDVFLTGSGTLQATINGVPVPVDIVGAKAGWDPDSAEPRPVVQVFVRLTDGSFDVIFIQVAAPSFTPQTIEHDLFHVFGGVLHFVPGDPAPTVIGIFGAGTTTLEAASTTNGQTIRGSVSTDVVAWPF